jgi:multisubunit Na+/H+ antiporter MnhE subunit
MTELRVKRALPSLIGGVGVAIFVLVLWLLLSGTSNPALVVAGVVVAAAVGVWVRLADL